MRRPTKMNQGPLRRINMKLDAVLVEWAFKYAQRTGTSITKLTEGFFKHLREKEEAHMKEDAEQV